MLLLIPQGSDTSNSAAQEQEPFNFRTALLEIALTWPDPDEEGAERHRRTIALSERDIQSAVRLLRLIAGQASEVDASEQQATAVETDTLRQRPLVLKAGRIIRNRQLRSDYFHRAIFSEAAWDILLVLYVTESTGTPQTQATLSKGLATPPTTVQRWVDYLEKEHLVRRDPHPTDRRTAVVSLLDKGRKSLEDYLAAVVE